MALPGWKAAAQQYPAYSPNTQCTRSHKGRFVGSPGGVGAIGGYWGSATPLTSHLQPWATTNDGNSGQCRYLFRLGRLFPVDVRSPPLVWLQRTSFWLTAGVQKSGRSSGTTEQHRMQYPFSPLDGSKSYTGLAF